VACVVVFDFAIGFAMLCLLVMRSRLKLDFALATASPNPATLRLFG
jgi:hypothetical protein